MPTLSGHQIHHLRISTDDTVDNYVELNTDVVDRVSWNRGRRSFEQHRGRDAESGAVRVVGRPTMQIIFAPDAAADKSIAVVLMGDEDPRAIDFQVKDSDLASATSGLRISGIALINDDGGETETRGVSRFTTTTVPAQGYPKWAFGRVVEAA